MGDHDPTDPDRPAHGPRAVVSGEADVPLEHTARVEALRGGRRAAPPTVHRVHDEEAPENEPGMQPAPRSSTELSDRARRERRRERDRRAERRALQVGVALFVGLAGLGWLGAQYLIDDTVPEPPPPRKVVAGEVADPPRPPGVVASAFEETADIPALRSLSNEGLTIAAEGLPEVLAAREGSDVAVYAAIETCRFAYGVWELSPNKRFRFMTTCNALEGQILVGAYEVSGTKVRMSPLITPNAEIISEIEVERPSRVSSKVFVKQQGREVAELEVKQRITAIRPGLNGEAFFDTFAPRNTVNLPGVAPRAQAPRGAPPPPPPPPPPPAAKDPLLELLEGNR